MDGVVTASPDLPSRPCHPAVFYRGETEYVAQVGGFVSGALEASAPVLVAVPGARLELLRGMIGDAFKAVTAEDMTEIGRNPGRILARLRAFAAEHGGRGARIVGEPIWPGRSPGEVVEATRHEALINLAFRDQSVTVLCPYDVDGLPAPVVADARRTHPVVVEGGRTRASQDYLDPVTMSARCDLPLSEPVRAWSMDYRRGELGEVREQAHRWATTSLLPPSRIADLVLAIGEAVANSVAHGGGRGTLRLWRAGGAVVAEIHDAGRLADPLAGRGRPSTASANGGRGLWIIHQLCDLVEVRARDSGLTLRLHMAEGH
ncbi:anti-sigma regulatory factor (Ser/Thr protein kinase) [Streptacidiphilus sp. MAP12-16]|uniref:anti-sigma factor RsbA family regulatory protein n=1 Tax=Streptacidiphilus sp. MAP12-16 TaxID=3156300 RepID=UPI003519C90F